MQYDRLSQQQLSFLSNLYSLSLCVLRVGLWATLLYVDLNKLDRFGILLCITLRVTRLYQFSPDMCSEGRGPKDFLPLTTAQK